MVLNERVWRIIPPSLEGAGWGEARMRAEVEIRSLMLQINRLEDLNTQLRRLITDAVAESPSLVERARWLERAREVGCTL